MPRLSFWLSALVCICACVNLCTGENFQSKSQTAGEDYVLPGAVKDTSVDQGEFDDKSEQAGEIIGNMETRSSISSLWSQILNRLGKTSETFVSSSRYPTRVSRTYRGQRLYAPLWSKLKLKRNNGGFEEESVMKDDKFKAAKQKKAGNLSINGALASLADMLAAEGHRRDQAAAHHLRQRLLVAGRRR